MLDWVSGDALVELLTNAMVFVLPFDLEACPWRCWMRWAPDSAYSLVMYARIGKRNDAGFTFRRGYVADLADQLRFLIANPAVREAAGQAARRRVREHYQWPQIAAEIDQVYFEVMGAANWGKLQPEDRISAWQRWRKRRSARWDKTTTAVGANKLARKKPLARTGGRGNPSFLFTISS